MASMYLLSQAYTLTVPGQPTPFDPALLDVLSWHGVEALNTPYRYTIDFTCPLAGMPMEAVLGQRATFSIQPSDPGLQYLAQRLGALADTASSRLPARAVHGLVTQFNEISSSADETHYQLVLEPRVSDLAREITSRLFQNQSVPAIIEAALRQFGFRADDFEFTLRASYANLDYVTQYDESTLAFIQRLAADQGIYFYFVQTETGEKIVFGDDLDGYAHNQLSVPLNPTAGLESTGAEAITALGRQHTRVPQSVKLNDYNHRAAAMPLLTEVNAARDDSTTGATDSRWGEHYRTPADGQRIATLRHQAHLAQQLIFEGSGNAHALTAGEVLTLGELKLPDAKYGLFITRVEHRASRRTAYTNSFSAIPSDRVYRPMINPAAWPRISGVIPARIASPDTYKYAYLSPEGWYRVQLPFDLDSWSPGGSSRPVRLSKPYAGRDYGHHFPLIDGTEVALIFTEGDPDRPIIMGALHDSQYGDHVTNQNNTRNIIRTAAQNELRMEDREGIEHVHLTTPHQTSELNLGHMVDAERKQRGEGAELRSDGHVAIRSAKGVFISADAQPSAAGQQLEMAAAQALLQQALKQMEALADAATSAQAIAADFQQQKNLLNQTLDGLKEAGLLLSAPNGIGLVSGGHLQLSAAKNLIATVGGNADIGVLKRFTVAAGEAVSLFAQKLGIQLTAAKGMVTIQAQNDELKLAALRDISLTTTEGKLILSADKEIWIGAGGSYIKLSPNGIENGTPGDIVEKCAMWETQGAGSELLKTSLPFGSSLPDFTRHGSKFSG